MLGSVATSCRPLNPGRNKGNSVKTRIPNYGTVFGLGRRLCANRKETFIMKTDSQLQQDVQDELKWEPSVDHEKIGVAVDKGVVTLSGLVPSFANKLLVEKAVRRVKGVRAIAEELVVRYASMPKTSDPEIAKRVADVLEWDSLIPRDKIKVAVE
jgi:osmotically-inducible protein OsmY